MACDRLAIEHEAQALRRACAWALTLEAGVD
jgi:hypothetical protein